MKKTILYVFVVGALVSMASCKCETCKHPMLGTTKLCKEDFNTTEQFNNAVSGMETAGYECKPSN